jgi:hypothetical protein
MPPVVADRSIGPVLAEVGLADSFPDSYSFFLYEFLDVLRFCLWDSF